MRTPLLRSLRRLVSDFRIARATGVPLDEVAERRQAALPRRRDVLRGAAAIGAGALVSGGARRTAYGVRQPTIAIVGGGIAGLSCALELADRGVASTVYEASARIGG